MVKWKTVFLIYIFLFILLFLTTSYQVTNKIAESYYRADHDIVFGSYNFTERGDISYIEFNNTLYKVLGRRNYKWNVEFYIENRINYVVIPSIFLKVLIKTNKTTWGHVDFHLYFYSNGEKADEMEKLVQITNNTYWARITFGMSYRYLRSGWNNLTVAVVTYWWMMPENESVKGNANYTIGPFEVEIGKLKTAFGLQPDYLLPGAVLLLPVSVALEILTRKFRRKLKRIERIKY
ncbi:MAG: hypothetical protein ACTSYM_08570 [Candidatus Baldrarchaeia archaeon]